MIIYKYKTNGQITSKIKYTTDKPIVNLKEGELLLETDIDVSPTDYFIVNENIVEKTQMPVSVSKYVIYKNEISNIVVPTNTFIQVVGPNIGESYLDNDGIIDFSSELAGDFIFRFYCHPYKNAQILIKVI